MHLASSYAGIEIASPIVIGASPLALELDRLHDLEVHGAGAIVMPSVFEEQITQAQFGKLGPTVSTKSDARQGEPLPKVGPDLDSYNGGTEGYLRHIALAKAATSMPIIANINCTTTGPWMRYAQDLESAGADAIELNLYHYEVDPNRFAEDIETELIDRVSQFCREAKLPVAVKLLQQFISLPNIVFRIAGAGARSVCLYGQSPSLDVQATKHIGYRWHPTTRSDLKMSLEGIHQAYGVSPKISLAASGGIQTPEDALTALRLGANVVMLTSAIYKQGSSLITTIIEAVKTEMEHRKLLHLKELIGSQSGGFNPFREASRRQEFTSSMAEFKPSET